MKSNFREIDTGFNFFDNIPFEIAIIFERGGFVPGSNGKWDSTRIFTKLIIENGQPFFAESYGYYVFAEYFEQGKLFTEDLQPITFENIEPYYKAYANGFYKGYNDYNTEVEHSTALFNKDIQTIANRVFKMVTTPIPNMTSTGAKRKGDNFVMTLKKSLWQEAGIKAGEKYKAWYFIINNPQLFTDLFRQDKQMTGTYKTLIRIYEDNPESYGLYLRLKELVQEIEGKGTNDPDHKKTKDYKAKDYALAYLFDCEAIGNRKYENQTQDETESDLYQYSKSKPVPNTIRKALDELKPKGDNVFNINTLADIAGKDWRTKIIELSLYPERLKTFLKNKQL